MMIFGRETREDAAKAEGGSSGLDFTAPGLSTPFI
jgi:hypothetical protein